MTFAIPYIGADDVEPYLGWSEVIDGLVEGHKRDKALIGDVLLQQSDRGFLSRAGWVQGIGPGLKTVTVFPENPSREVPRPAVQGVFLLFDETSGAVKAIIDGALITKWKTAADSVLGAQLLANPGPRRLLILGTGALARGLVDAYTESFPEIESVGVWGRHPGKAQKLSEVCGGQGRTVEVITDLAAAAAEADIISAATAARTPVLKGDWVRPGTHIDLAGAYLPDTREADDATLKKARLFVDSRETTLDHIGELKIPLEAGVISRADMLGDLYDLVGGVTGRRSTDDITVFKNGGGAHLDLMTAAVIFRVWENNRSA